METYNKTHNDCLAVRLKAPVGCMHCGNCHIDNHYPEIDYSDYLDNSEEVENEEEN